MTILIILFLILCSSHSSSYTYEYARQYFNKTLMIVAYNFKPPVKNIINHYNIWKDIFPNQFIVGHYDHIEQNIIINELRLHISNNTKNLHIASAIKYDLEPGFLNYKILYYAISQLQEYDGYLFLHDDMAINMTKLLNLNLDRKKIWQETWTGTLGTTPMKTSFDKVSWSNKGVNMGYPWFNSKWGISAINKLIDSNHDIKSILKTCSGNNSEGYDLHVCESDFIYFPGSIAHELKKTVKLFADYEVFLEIAIPTIVTCWFPHVEKIYLLLCTYWDDRYNYRLYEEQCKQEILYHPLKFSSPGGMELMQKLSTLEGTR